jgi:hypothetical protein
MVQLAADAGRDDVAEWLLTEAMELFDKEAEGSWLAPSLWDTGSFAG